MRTVGNFLLVFYPPGDGQGPPVMRQAGALPLIKKEIFSEILLLHLGLTARGRKSRKSAAWVTLALTCC